MQQLLWMHAHKIISEDELDDVASFDDEPCERAAILQADGGLDRLQMVEDVQVRLDARKKARRSDPGTIRMYTDPSCARRVGWSYLAIIALIITGLAWLLLH